MFSGTFPSWNKHLFPDQSSPMAGTHLDRYDATVIKD